MYTLYRKEQDGTKTIVAFVDDQIDIGCVMDEDREKLDYEAVYFVEIEKPKNI